MTLKMMSVSSLMFLDLEITQMIPKVQEPRGERRMLTSHHRHINSAVYQEQMVGTANLTIATQFIFRKKSFKL